jgi:hypothetical protein
MAQKMVRGEPALPEIHVLIGRTLSLGRIEQTGRARRELAPHEVLVALARHAKRDWGCVSEDRWESNVDSMLDAWGYIESLYRSQTGEYFTVSTNCDWTLTVVDLAPNYEGPE